MMKEFKCRKFPYTILHQNGTNDVYPYLRDPDGDKVMYQVSPNHGRSFLINPYEPRVVVSKGNGLGYSPYSFIHTGEMGNDTWGLLRKEDAERDFYMGLEIEKLGIKTNKMEYVLEIDDEIMLTNGQSIKPVLLQYSVECPWRLNDAPYMSSSDIWNETMKWERLNVKCYDERYLIAAYVLVRNLRILHDHGILHNAIHEQNYTWALELLDFELACSPAHPYTSADDMRHVKDLFPREIIYTYIVINYIAGVLRERMDHRKVEQIFNDYGFDLAAMQCKFK